MGGWMTVLLGLVWAIGAQAAPATLPKVRAITAFVRLDRQHAPAQIDAALAVLRAARGEFERRGYAVETLRLVTQPLAELVRGQSEAEAIAFLARLGDRSVHEDFLPNVGPAMLRDTDDPAVMHLAARALATLPRLNASAIIAAEDGIHWRVIHESALLVRHLTEHSPHSQGNFNFTATAMLKPYGPFYPGAYFTGADHAFSIGLEGAGVVQEVLAHAHGDFNGALAELTRALSVHARIAEAVGEAVATRTHWTYEGFDPTPAPLGDVSIGAAIESYTGARFGSSGTLTAALLITSAVKAVPVKQIGYSGLMVPVMEDKRLAERWAEGSYGTDDLLAYSAVCGTGLDTVPYPGDIHPQQLERIYGDVAALAWKWNKPLSARLQPIAGSQAGDRTAFEDPHLFNTTLQPLP